MSKKKSKKQLSDRKIVSWILVLYKWIRRNPALFLSLVTAYALIWQNINIGKQVTLYENELQFEQKPILDHSIGEIEASRWDNGRLIVTEHVLNRGRLPAYNIVRRYSIRSDNAYPLTHFQAETEEDSIWHNILSTGIPRFDTLSIDIETNANVESIEDLARIMDQTELDVYVHYWVEYEDVSQRGYVLRQTFRLTGTPAGILRWSQEYAQEFEAF
ncbi:MAG: hypothetical protein ACTSYJ_02395 [Candidatus Thorarchaeota archaeon]